MVKIIIIYVSAEIYDRVTGLLIIKISCKYYFALHQISNNIQCFTSRHITTYTINFTEISALHFQETHFLKICLHNNTQQNISNVLHLMYLHLINNKRITMFSYKMYLHQTEKKRCNKCFYINICIKHKRQTMTQAVSVSIQEEAPSLVYKMS